MNAENRLKLAEICIRFYSKGTDEQVKVFTTYVELGIQALQRLESSKEKPKPETKSKAKEKKTSN